MRTISDGLYRLATGPGYDRGVVSLIQRTLSDSPVGLRLHGQLSSTDPTFVSEALCEIASSRRAVQVLRASTDVQRELEKVVSSATPQKSPVPQALEQWAQSLRRTGPDGLNIDPLGVWREAEYWGSGAAVYLGFPSSFFLSLLQIERVLSSAHPTLQPLVASLLLMGAGLAASHQRHTLARSMIDTARGRPLGLGDSQAFFDQFRWPFEGAGFSDRPFPSSSVSEIIRESAGPGGRPVPSIAATFRTVYDFMNLGTIATATFLEDSSGSLYDKVVPAVILGLLQRLRWQPMVLHPERLEDLKKRKEDGWKILFVTNHRSYIDILVSALVLHELSPRFVAKRELVYTPVLGWTPQHHPLKPSRWVRDGLLRGARHPLIDRSKPEASHRSILDDGRKVLEAGHVLFTYPEGTRSDTPDRSREFGLRPFKDGPFHLVAGLGDRTMIVPLALYGLGGMFPKSTRDLLFEGAMVNQPVVLSVGEPIEYGCSDFEPRQGQERKERIQSARRAVWKQLWEALWPIQDYMNSKTPPSCV